jgi:hypothetical protein
MSTAGAPPAVLLQQPSSAQRGRIPFAAFLRKPIDGPSAVALRSSAFSPPSRPHGNHPFMGDRHLEQRESWQRLSQQVMAKKRSDKARSKLEGRWLLYHELKGAFWERAGEGEDEEEEESAPALQPANKYEVAAAQAARQVDAARADAAPRLSSDQQAISCSLFEEEEEVEAEGEEAALAAEPTWDEDFFLSRWPL